MKKILLLSVCVLAGCAETIQNENGLNRLNFEPKECYFLYTVDSSATVYGKNDAYDYLEKTILEQKNTGDSYFIAKEEILENAGAIFGPKNTYKFRAKVYNCKK